MSLVTRVSIKKKKKLLEIYNTYLNKYNQNSSTGNFAQAEIYHHKMKAVRTALTLLEIHIEGINAVIREGD